LDFDAERDISARSFGGEGHAGSDRPGFKTLLRPVEFSGPLVDRLLLKFL
jgi:hypothetical protein